jgi:hypothetical protein
VLLSAHRERLSLRRGHRLTGLGMDLEGLWVWLLPLGGRVGSRLLGISPSSPGALLHHVSTHLFFLFAW